MLQSIVTWLMTVVLILLAGVTIIGFLMFIGNRQLNKYMFSGFILFIICTLIFTKIFGYRMEFFGGAVGQIGFYSFWYLWFLSNGIPAQTPPDVGESICALLKLLCI